MSKNDDDGGDEDVMVESNRERHSLLKSDLHKFTGTHTHTHLYAQNTFTAYTMQTGSFLFVEYAHQAGWLVLSPVPSRRLQKHWEYRRPHHIQHV